MHAVITFGGLLEPCCCIWEPLNYLKQRVSVALHCTMITLRKDSELAKQNMPSLQNAGPLLSLFYSLTPSLSHSLAAVLNKHTSAAGLPKTAWKWNSNPVFFCSWHCSDLYARKKLQEKIRHPWDRDGGMEGDGQARHVEKKCGGTLQHCVKIMGAFKCHALYDLATVFQTRSLSGQLIFQIDFGIWLTQHPSMPETNTYIKTRSHSECKVRTPA